MIFVKARPSDFIQEICDLVRAFFPKDSIDAQNAYAEDGILIACGYSRENPEQVGFYANYLECGILKQEVKWHRSIEEGDNPILYRRLLKNALKTCVYELLSNLLDRTLSWGTLTGIRPVKLLHQMLDARMDEATAAQVLQKDYRLSLNKSALLFQIARIQRPYLTDRSGGRVSVYIHIPFCTSRCLYCSFPSELIHKASDKLDAYMACLCLELRTFMAQIDAIGALVDTVYIGGGTPTALSSVHLKRLLETVEEVILRRQPVEEFTVEAGRPDSLTFEKLKMLKDYGTTRISINPQTMNQDTLDRIGRSHQVEDINRCYDEARQLHFQSINMDMILGLTGEDGEAVSRTLKGILKLRPENLTIHTLAVKRASELKTSLERFPLAAEGDAEKMATLCSSYTKASGYLPYYLYRQKYMLDNLENVGYTLPGFECRYNIHIMEEKRSIWAFGAGAISKVYYPETDRLERIANVKNIHEYVTRIEEMIEKKQKMIDH